MWLCLHYLYELLYDELFVAFDERTGVKVDLAEVEKFGPRPDDGVARTELFVDLLGSLARRGIDRDATPPDGTASLVLHLLGMQARNLVDVVNVLLRDLANDIGIYKGDTRLSVYRHSGDKFYLVGRVSPNEDYAAVGPTWYPDTQGFIGQVWRAADDKTNVTFPGDRQDWIDTQVESYGFTDAEAAGLKISVGE